MGRMYITIHTMFLKIKIKKPHWAQKEFFKKIQKLILKIIKYKKYQIMKKRKIKEHKD